MIGRDSSARDRVAAILRAAGASAELLLAADDWRTAVPGVLAALGEATQASRVYVFENGRAADGTLTTSQRFEWTAPGITAQGDRLLGVSYKDVGFSRWVGLLEDGGTISGPVSELPALERPFLEAQQVRSILIVPVRAGARWWGLIGFDDCISERDHSPAENDLLRAAGSSLGAAIARSEMHRELRTSEARYRLLAENFPHGAVVMFDHDLRYTLAEGRGLGAVGLDGTTMVGRTLDEVFPGETGRLIEGDCRRALAGELVTNVVSYAGRVFRTVTAPVRGDSGEVTAGMAVMQDITDAEEQAARLRRSEAMYGELVEHAAYGIYRSTPAGAFLSVNPALVRMLGYESAAELLAVDLRSLYERIGERERLLELPGADVSVDVPEVVWLHKSGRSLIVRLTGRAVHDHDGRLECFEMFVEDVTERRALEAQLRQSQKMEAIGQLVGGIAHDFNNLLTTVMGNAELVLESVGPPGTDAGDAAADIRDAAASGAALVRKMMTVSRKEALSIRSADLAVLTTDVLRMARRILPSNIAVSADIPNVPQVARFDRGAVEQVLLNLLTNARDAMPSGGRLRVAIAETELSRERRAVLGLDLLDRLVCLSVTDTGQGMDAETVARIYEPFFTTKPAGSGTGLGLAMVYGLMQQHRGAIAVTSELGRGTTARLYFVAGDSVAPDAAAKRARLVLGEETILLVDDNVEARTAAARLLQRSGYRILQASDGEEALAIVRANARTIALVLTDVMMPRLGGRALYDAVQQFEAPPLFLFCSGYLRPEELDGINQDASVSFLPKPWTASELTRAVRRVLDGAELRSGPSAFPG